MKTKDGDFIHIVWDDFDSDVEYVKGHVTLDQATQVYKEIWGIDTMSICGIKHRFARWVPASNWSDFSMLFYAFDEKKRGAFPVTELQLRKGEA